jgi:two-component system, NarL family, nitrate/nitrite response regulator NarL
MTPIQAIRILLIEDHLVIQAGLSLLIESRPGLLIVGLATNGDQAITLAAREQPDIILLDLDLGRENGLDLLSGLHAVASEARVVILTGVRDVEAHQEAIRRGVSGLVLKEQAAEVLLKAIERVHAGEIWIERAMLADVLNKLVSGAATAADPEAARVATLTERERQVAALIGAGLKNKQIGERLGITETTVRHHLSSIFTKLGIGTRLELTILVHRRGLTA